MIKLVLFFLGELLAFGYNQSGQLGLGDNENRNKPILSMQDSSIQ